MAKKEKKALFFVKRRNILYAVVDQPERTVAPKETAHFILCCGINNKRYKMKQNTVVFATEVITTETGVEITKVDKTNVISFTPNFEKLSGEQLRQMWEKSSPAFKRTFPLT